MKKLLYTLLAVSLIFSACKKEESDEGGGVNQFKPLIGLWDYDSYEYDGEITLMPTGYQWEFLSNGYMNILENDTVQDIYPYTHTNTQFTLTDDGVDVILTYDISASNNMLQIFQTIDGLNSSHISNFSRH
jgi:hypothetical protein